MYKDLSSDSDVLSLAPYTCQRPHPAPKVFFSEYHHCFTRFIVTSSVFYEIKNKTCNREMLSVDLSSVFTAASQQYALAVALQSKFIEITLRHGCPPVYLMHVFRKLFTKNSYGGLLLTVLK